MNKEENRMNKYPLAFIQLNNLEYSQLEYHWFCLYDFPFAFKVRCFCFKWWYKNEIKI